MLARDGTGYLPLYERYFYSQRLFYSTVYAPPCNAWNNLYSTRVYEGGDQQPGLFHYASSNSQYYIAKH